MKPRRWKEIDLPALAKVDEQALRESIKRHGYIGPPVYILPDGRIIDGHHRWKIAKDKCKVEVLDVEEDTARALAYAHNSARRQLSPEQLREIRERLEEGYRELRKQGYTQAEAAAAVGVDQSTGSRWEKSDGSNMQSHKASIDLRLSIPRGGKEAIVERVEAGETQAKVAADFRVSRRRVGQIVQQERKRRENASKVEESRSKITKDAGFDGLYDVVVIDPPWPMKKIDREVRPNQSEFEYPTMDEDELAALSLPCKAHCHVWLWTTHRFLPMAFRLLEAWSLDYVCTFVWHKPGGFQPVGLPQYNCEFALYARSGSPEFRTTKALSVCYEAPRAKHSEKPDAFYDMVRRATSGRRIDIFNRRSIDGFTGWGNEAAGS